ncbi:MAG: hypothetical protein H7Y41_01685 [Hyphomonadaceae bacterium]|nr:hypothetical protein [Clostridia bacterium]
MNKSDTLKDILQSKMSNQLFYNENLITIRNPEVRQVFTQMRDDETRSIVKLQKNVQKLDAAPNLITKIFPSKARY